MFSQPETNHGLSSKKKRLYQILALNASYTFQPLMNFCCTPILQDFSLGLLRFGKHYKYERSARSRSAELCSSDCDWSKNIRGPHHTIFKAASWLASRAAFRNQGHCIDF